MVLSKRLEACLRYTEGYLYLADIGTDHAMLPIEAVLRGNVEKALAIDNKFGPYLQARTNIKKYHVEDRVTVRLGDGLEKITDDIDVVVISGMGGELIANILQDHSHRHVKRFVLQPNRDADVVRKAIVAMGYHIMDELVLAEQDKFYDVLIIEKGTITYTRKQLQFGPINLVQKPYFFTKRLEKELEQYRRIIAQVHDQERKQELAETIRQIEEVLQ